MEKELLDKVCNWLDNNIFNYIETKSRGHDILLTKVDVSSLLEDLRGAMTSPNNKTINL